MASQGARVEGGAGARPGFRSEVSAALREPVEEAPSGKSGAAPTARGPDTRAGSGGLAGTGRDARVGWDEDGAVWYLGDDRGEYGPMTFSELAARARRGEPGPSAEVWKEGMEDWLPIGDVPELQPYLRRAPPRRATAEARVLPASPYQKRPDMDAAPVAPRASEPVAARVGASRGVSAPRVKALDREVHEPFLRAEPPAPVKGSRPGHTSGREDSWPAVPAVPAVPAAPAVPEVPASSGASVLPGANSMEEAWPDVPVASAAHLAVPASRQGVDVFSLPVGAEPSPEQAPCPGVGLSPAAHVSVREASDLSSLLVQEQKAARRPMLLISLAVLMVAGAAVVLAVWIISSGKRPSEAGAGQGVVQAPSPASGSGSGTPGQGAGSLDMGSLPAMEVDQQGGGEPEVQELEELDIDVSLGEDAPRAFSTPKPRSGMGSKRPTEALAPPNTRSSEPSADPVPVTTRGPMLTAIRSLGGSDTGGSSGVGAAQGAPSDLGGVVRRNYNSLKRCYENAARMDSRLKDPRLTLSIRVSSGGRVTGVAVSPERHASDNLGLCVRRAIMSWQFPGHGGDYRYSFTARFHGG